MRKRFQKIGNCGSPAENSLRYQFRFFLNMKPGLIVDLNHPTFKWRRKLKQGQKWFYSCQTLMNRIQKMHTVYLTFYYLQTIQILNTQRHSTAFLFSVRGGGVLVGLRCYIGCALNPPTYDGADQSPPVITIS